MIEKLLRLSCFFVFLGRGYEHIFFDAPYRAFFWDEELLKPLVEGFSSCSWHEYVTSPLTDLFIEKIVLAIGIFYLICAYLSLFVKKDNLWRKRILFIGSVSLFILSLLKFKTHFYQIGQILELTLQWSSGLFLIYYINQEINPSDEKLYKFLKLAVGLTFLGHGLYAIGYYPVPGKFIDMIIIMTALSEDQSLLFLQVAGVFDIFVFSFCNLNLIDKYVFSFAAIWGGFTSFARIGTSLFLSLSLSSLHSSFYEVIFRLPHFLIPLACVYISLNNQKNLSPQNLQSYVGN